MDLLSESVIYKSLYDLSNTLMNRYNPCQINGHSCLAGKENPCCCNVTIYSESGDVGCKYFIDDKCTKPNLECATWFCATAIKNMSAEVFDVFKAVETLAKHFNLISMPYLGQPYVGADRP